VASVVASAIARERGRGAPLSRSVAEPLQVRFGDDFSDVRVHANAGAAAALQARAFTVGSDIFFAPGEYHPGDHDGQRLLAHELTHVVQQRGAPVDVSTVEPQGSRAEREADAVADAVVGGREPKQVSAAPLGIPRDVGWARRGPIPDPNGIGYNTILAKAGDAFKDAILALASLETPSMFVNLEAYKKLPLQTRKAILALEPHAAGTACQGWFDVMRANDPDLKPTHTPAEIAAGEAAYYGASREAAVRHKVEEAKQAPGSMTGMDVEKKWSTNKYGLITLAQTPNHGLKADALHAIWVSYWADRIKVAESTIDAMDQRQLHDPQHPDASDDPGYKQAEAVRDLGRSLLADSVGAIEICRAADAMGKSLTLDELDDQVIRHSKFMERLQLLTMVASTISASRGGRPRGRAARGRQSAPVKGEPVKTEPVKTEPVKTEPVKTEPVKTEPVKTEPENKPSVTPKSPKHGYTGEWPPPDPGPRPSNASSEEMASWRYKRYARDAYKAGKAQGEILNEEGYKPYANVADKPGARPGRGGGAAQKAARTGPAAEAGYKNTETTQLGSRTNPRTGATEANMVDGVKPNAKGGTDYLEVDDMNANGLPSAKIRSKLKSEVEALKPNDSLEFWDKNDPSRRIRYEAGEDSSVVDSRKGPTLPRKPRTPNE
jgi:hypothetical protein